MMSKARIEALEKKMVAALEGADEQEIEKCMKQLLPVVRKILK